MAFAENERFERPHRPEWHDHGKRLVLANNALVSLKLQLQIITQQARMFFCAIAAKGFVFARRKVRQRSSCPDLAMRVRVAGAHQLAAVFENLDMANPGKVRERRKLIGPSVNHSPQFAKAHPRDGEIMPRRKTQGPTSKPSCSNCNGSTSGKSPG